MQCVAVLLVLTTASLLPPGTNSHACDNLDQQLLPLRFTGGSGAGTIVRKVNQNGGADNVSCLNEDRVEDPPPCASLIYALHGTHDRESRGAQENITIYVAAGTYRPTEGEIIGIINSQNIALIGSQAQFQCGAYAGEDRPCSYRNFQIRNSINVYVRGFTFTRCGPITSSVYIAMSEHIVFEDCTFRDNISPPFLVYMTSPIIVNSSKFLDNYPKELNDSDATNTCYFSGGVDVFFLDNRTSAGGISHYSESEPVQMYIVACEFRNNLARPDRTVSLPRQSEGYGHGGAINMRMSNSSFGEVCIKSCVFVNNTAEAQAGAVSVTIGGSSSYNDIELDNCQFLNNSCTLDQCTGGAMAIDFFFNTSLNEVLIKGTDFIRNSAATGTGGAISLSTTVGTVTENGRSDALILEDCLFEKNRGFYDGTALGVFSLTHTEEIGLPVNITDCQFLRNEATRGSSDSTALTAYRVLITFTGTSSFTANQGGGVSLLSSRMDVRGEITLDQNIAVFGAGIAMSGRSLLLLHDGAVLNFTNNFAVDKGAGIYVEYTSSDFVLPILNRGCFIQYFTTFIDLPPNEWNACIEFVNNTADIAGAAIYANDMSRCKWLGPVNYTDDFFIFNTPEYYSTPFLLKNNTVRNKVTEKGSFSLATDASNFTATTEYGEVGFGEKISFLLMSHDQFNNSRESVWAVNTPDVQRLGALSSTDTLFEYEIPSRKKLADLGVEGDSLNITVGFSILGGQATLTKVELQVHGCHPGYLEQRDTCVCDDSNPLIVQCDDTNRYFYARLGWILGWCEEWFSNLLYNCAGILNCTRQGTLPGCEIRYDYLDEQCAESREGVGDTLCGECKKGRGVTFDLRFCRHCGVGGTVLFVFICLLTVFLALLILFYDFPLPDELKGFIFFAQVIGVIYRNAPYLLGQTREYQFFDVLINLLGLSLPFPVCPAGDIPAFGIALLGFVPPLLATSAALLYICLARRSKYLSERDSFNGFHFLYIFVYKYFLDTSFIFVSCTLLGDDYVFIYQGTVKCFQFPFVLLFAVGLVLLVVLGALLPSYQLYLVYRPGRHVQAADALTRGLKRKRRYRWYGVWDVWRRILFVAANLLISVTTRNVVLLIHCLLIIICLAIVCVVKPYKKAHNNVSEVIILLCLIGATLAVLDDEDMNVGAMTGIVFAMLPFIYGLVYILFRIGTKVARYIWAKGRESKRERVKIAMTKMSTMYDKLMENRAVAMAMKFVGMATDRECSTRHDANIKSDRSSGYTLPSQRSCDQERGEEEGSRQNDLLELISRTSTISAELREPLLEDDNT